MGADASARLLQRSRLPQSRQQVAAVCYRIRKGDIEFLLVQTRSERWIFPKGGVESGLTHGQSAALEAFEEAGVHGRTETIPFARYVRRRRDAAREKDTRYNARSAPTELAVTAHLCEVSRLEPPQESHRKPTWFSAEKAKVRLLKKRAPEFGAELARIIDRATARIRRVHESTNQGAGRANLGHGMKDALQEVRFEAFEIAQRNSLLWSTSYARYIRRGRPSTSRFVQQDIPVDARLYNRPALRLESGVPFSPARCKKCNSSLGSAQAAGSKRRRNLPRTAENLTCSGKSP
jgi:8-oxo-dGTP pyrophosphatase MutT (NUDIX family)